MLKSIHLSNFQSYKDSYLEFDPGVNIIVGASDSGKTAILRALRWVVWNRPSGDAFRSTWGGETSVTLQINGQSIQRVKDKAEEYKLGETSFKAFGTSIPEEIIQALNLNEINLQQQLDSPFLLSNSPGEVAKHFNKIAHLDQIDSGSSNVQKWIRGIEQDITSKDKQLVQSNEDLEKFVYLEKFEIDLEVLEGIETKMINEVTGKNKLIALVGKITEVFQEYTEQSYILKAEPLVNKILGWYEKKEQTSKNCASLEKLTFEIYEIEHSWEIQNQILQSENLVDSLIQLHEDRFKNIAEANALEELVEKIRRTKKKITSANETYKYLHEKFKKEFPDTCPLCNKPK